MKDTKSAITWWKDGGLIQEKKDDILYANALILDERAVRRINGEIVNSKIDGKVSIDKGTNVTNSNIRGPVVIGENCYIDNSFIGLYTSIGSGTRIINSGVKYCVILNNAVIEGINRVEESLIGRNAKATKNSGKGTIKLHVGDYSEVKV